METGEHEQMTEPHLLDALARLNQVGLAINRLDTGDLASIQTMLRMIVESAAGVVPGSSAVIYTYDEERGAFHHDSRVSAERSPQPGLDDSPRTEGLGDRTVSRRRRVLSYEEPDLEINPAKVAMGARAMGCFPLVVAGEVLGVLYVYLHEERHFSDLELLMLENFTNLTAMTVSLARQFGLAQQEQARKERELRRLRRAGMLISSRSNLKATLEAILQVALEVTDAVYGIFRLVDPGGKNLVTQAISQTGLNQPAVETLAIDEHSVMGLVATRREPVIVSDLRQEPWNRIYYPLDRGLEMRSELAVPLTGASGRLEGVLNLESPQVNAFDRQDRYILQILATQAVVAIQEARLLDALEEISLLLPRYSLERIHQTLVERACDLLNAPYGMVWLLDGDQLALQAAAGTASGGAPERIKGQAGDGSAQVDIPQRIALEGTLAGRAVLEARPVSALARSADQPVAYPDLPFFKGRGSALSVPLYNSPDGRPAGAFTVHTGQGDPRDFDQSDWDKKVLDILGHYAALAGQLAAQQDALRAAQDQRALTEAFAAIGDIAANLLHRLNNKVGTIPVRVEGIQDKCAALLQGDPYLARNLEEIQRSASEAMEVVRESLFHLHPIQLAPVSVLGSVRAALAATRLPPGVAVTVEGLELLPPVQAGPRRLEMVFNNLLENAADALGGEGAIHVTGSAAGGWVEVVVKDDGPGIPLELHERIFEFNYSSRKAAQPGKLGFGLWWVKSLMARFGGSVAVRSDGQSGTTFILRLPQVKDIEAGQMA
jgi:signal transduction histidine kinase/transcriptional regulator with GAF, ATPase, and Fis domain